MTSPWFQARSPSLRFLLHLEWILLVLVGLSELLPLPRHSLEPLRIVWLNELGLGLFALMGGWLPVLPWLRVLYTGLELGLLWLLADMGGIRLFALLYIVLVMRNCLIFERQYRWLVTAIAFVACITLQIDRLQELPTARLLPRMTWIGPSRLLSTIITFSLLIGLVMVFLQYLVNALLAESRSRQELAVANDRLRQYALRIEDQATLQERNRIAREIHDSLGHSLTAFNLHLEAALRLLQSDPEEAQALLIEAKQLGSKALQSVRQSVSTLRSDPLEGKALPQAIAELVEDVRRSTGMQIYCHVTLTQSPSRNMTVALYRIIQEALTNVCKYAAATEVSIALHDRHNPSDLTLVIRDNGKGFNPDQTLTGFGLQGMQERTMALGGEFEIAAAPGTGCQITVHIPISPHTCE